MAWTHLAVAQPMKSCLALTGSRLGDRLQRPGKVHVQAGKETTAQTFLGRHLDDLNRSFQVKKVVFTKLGRTLDKFVTGFRGDTQREHRATARHLVSMELEHLNTKVFDTSSSHDCFPRMPSIAPKTASHDANPPAAVRVAPRKAKAKEDIRVLVTVAEGAPRPEPFQLRHKLVTMLKGSPYSACAAYPHGLLAGDSNFPPPPPHAVKRTGC
ncbi:hypothetical protein E4U49_000553 [Claviceps purpurea]|nr:hypothetical protein E4U49_000553 [Claviceps purpurea]